MQLIAKTDFVASIDGCGIQMKKGEVFTGSAKAAEKLSAVLEKKSMNKKEANNGR